MKKIIPWVNAIIRIAAISLLFLINPIIAILISMLLDALDGPAYEYLAKLEKSRYQRDDKILDYLYYVGLLVFIIYHHLPALPWLIFLFVYRSIGQFIFFWKKKRVIFVYFPNFFESFVLGFLLLEEIEKRQLFPQIDLTIPLFLIIIVLKIWHEIFLHWQKKSMSEILWLPLWRLIKSQNGRKN